MGYAALTASGQQTASRSPAFRAIDAVLLVIAPLIFGWFLIRPVADPDSFFHVVAGRHLARTGAFVGPETFSRYATEPWVLHEWLGQLPIALSFDLFGYAGVAWWSALQAMVLLLVVFVGCRCESRMLVSVMVTTLAFLAASISVGPRPQVLSFVFLAVTVTAWLASAGDSRPRWYLIPLTWLWACTHGFWFLGPAIGIAAIAGIGINRTHSRADLRRLALVPFAQLVIAAATPLGLAIYATGAGMVPYTRYVEEWQRPDITNGAAILALTLAAAVVVGWFSRRVAFSWVHFAFWAGGVTAILTMQRLIPVGAVLMAPLAAHAFERLLPPSSSGSRASDIGWWILGSSVALTVVALLLPRVAAEPEGMPSKLDDRLQSLPYGTGIINEYVLGGWILLEHPNFEPVIDGRADVYPMAHFEGYMGAYEGRGDWRAFVTTTDAEWALLGDDNGLRRALSDDLGWCLIGSDAGYDLMTNSRTC